MNELEREVNIASDKLASEDTLAVALDRLERFRERICYVQQAEREFPTFLLHCANGDWPRVEEGLRQHPDWARSQNQSGETALFYAIGNGRTECVAQLAPLSDFSQRTSNRRFAREDKLTPLMLASVMGLSILLPLLLPFDDPTLVNRQGFTALMLAASEGRTDCVELLMPVSNLDQRDPQGRTALMIAAHQTHSEALKRLLQGGPLLSLDHEKRDALEIAILAFEQNPGHSALTCITHLLEASSPLKGANSLFLRLSRRESSLAHRAPHLFALLERDMLSENEHRVPTPAAVSCAAEPRAGTLDGVRSARASSPPKRL